jgi:hypothetical protein
MGVPFFCNGLNMLYIEIKQYHGKEDLAFAA